MIKIYAYKNNYDGTYYPPFFKPEDKDDLVRQVNQMVVCDPDKAHAEHMDIVTLCYLGTFDQKAGKFELVDPEILLDLSVPYHQITSLRGDGNGRN